MALVGSETKYGPFFDGDKYNVLPHINTFHEGLVRKVLFSVGVVLQRDLQSL